MTSYVTRAPVGFPGVVSRENSKTIQQELIDSATPPTAYGSVVKLVSGKLQPVASGDAGTVAFGWLVKAYPVQSTTNAYGAATPPTSGIIDVLRRGYMTITLKLGTAAKNGQVYVVTTAGGTVVVGDIVTAASPAGGGTGVAVPGAFFEGPADANGVVEISHNI